MPCGFGTREVAKRISFIGARSLASSGRAWMVDDESFGIAYLEG
jgi:hypothetical protein